MGLKQLVLQLVYGHKSSSEQYVSWLRSQGMHIGQHVHLYTPWSIKIDTQRPWMIEIGDNVHITADCSILQHDYSWAVIQRLTGEVLGSCGTVRIGNNVFVGQKSLILKGAEIGDNTIIGAGSVVTGRLDGNAVYAGAPAKKISSLEAYIDKRRKLQLNEAVLLVREYEQTYGKQPPKKLLREFFWLFEPRNTQLDEVFQKVFQLDNNTERSQQAFVQSEPMFSSYEAFLKYVESNS